MIRGVEFLEADKKRAPGCTEFALESLRDPQWIAALKKPVVYLVRKSDLHRIRTCGDTIIDRGVKDRRKGLPKYLCRLRKTGTPLIDGNFGSIRQVARSIRNLLSHARVLGENNLFIVGVQDTFFSEIWGMAERDSSFHPSFSLSKPEKDIGSYAEDFRINLLNLIRPHAIPKSLDETFVGRSLEMQLVKQMIMCAAEVDNPVLIIGGTGTGKEVVAGEIHRLSGKRGASPISVNCGAIPGELFEAELFGYVRGAFTGAIRNKVGKWRHANDGTLFLDEVGDLQLDHQAKILRVLAGHEIVPVGALKPENVNARIISATNRDLYSMVRQGQFREDLFYRLCGIIIRTPSLRDIPSDIPLIANDQWKEITKDKQAVLTDDVIDGLMHHQWPGNVRELKVVLGQMLALFGKKNLNGNHVKTVFSLLGQVTKDFELPERERNILQIAKALNHLKSVTETIHALKAHFHSPRKATGREAKLLVDSLRFHLNDLEFLCREPSLFGEKETFLAVHHLLGQLHYLFDSLQKDSLESADNLKDNIEKEIGTVLLKVSHTIDVLKDKA